MKSVTFFCGLLLWGCANVNAALDNDQRDAILREHNIDRVKCAENGQASNMNELVWDDGLASIAQTYAEQCIWGHSTPASRNGAGENLYVTSVRNSNNPVKGVENWYNEYDDMAGQADWWTYAIYWTWCNGEGVQCGHLSQMCWADTTRVGCGWHSCNAISGIVWNDGSSGGTILVCNYDPPGNYNRGNMFERGGPCSACTGGDRTGDCTQCELCDVPGGNPVDGPNDCLCSGVVCNGDDCNDSYCTGGSCVNTVKTDGTSCDGDDGAGSCDAGTCVTPPPGQDPPPPPQECNGNCDARVDIMFVRYPQPGYAWLSGIYNYDGEFQGNPSYIKDDGSLYFYKFDSYWCLYPVKGQSPYVGVYIFVQNAESDCIYTVDPSGSDLDITDKCDGSGSGRIDDPNEDPIDLPGDQMAPEEMNGDPQEIQAEDVVDGDDGDDGDDEADAQDGATNLVVFVAVCVSALVGAWSL